MALIVYALGDDILRMRNVTVKWSLATKFIKIVGSGRVDGHHTLQRRYCWFQNSCVDVYLVSGEDITRYAKVVTILKSNFHIFFSHKSTFFLISVSGRIIFFPLTNSL